MKVELSVGELGMICSVMAQGLQSLEKQDTPMEIIREGDRIRDKIIHWVEYGVKA